MSASGKIVNMSIAGIIFSTVGATSLLQLANMNTTGMSSTNVVLLGVVTIAFILGGVVLFLKEAGIKIS